MNLADWLLFAIALACLWEAHRKQKRIEELTLELTRVTRYWREALERADIKARAEQLTAYQEWARKDSDHETR